MLDLLASAELATHRYQEGDWSHWLSAGSHGCFSLRDGDSFLSKLDDKIVKVCGVMLLVVPSMKPITFPFGPVSFFRATSTLGSAMKFSSSMRTPFVASNDPLK